MKLSGQIDRPAGKKRNVMDVLHEAAEDNEPIYRKSAKELKQLFNPKN